MFNSSSDCSKSKNLSFCTCTYEPCSRKGVCCACLQYHRKNREIPACFFSPEAEKTYDRSIDRFIKDHQKTDRV